MPHSQQNIFRNELLRILPDEDLAELRRCLDPVPLPVRQTLVTANKPIEFAYFIEHGVASIVNDSTDGKIELGIIGWDGFVGIPILLGSDRMPYEVFMQIDGHGLRIEAGRLIDLSDKLPALRNVLLRYAHAMSIQTAQTAFSNANNSVEARLARWLLMCHDRSDSNDIALTHEFMAMMLGVRRAGVTVALHILEGNKLIRSKRGVVTILDRPRLMELADDGYGIPEAEYARVMATDGNVRSLDDERSARSSQTSR